MKTLLALTFLGSVLTGCVTAKLERLSPASYPPISPDSVTVFMDPGELRVDSIRYERLAMIFTKGSAEFTSTNQHLRKAREEAAKLGANGLVTQSQESGGRYNWFWGTSSPKESSLMAIRWWIESVPAALGGQALIFADTAAQTVTVEPTLDTVRVGEQLQLTAKVHNSAGVMVPSKRFRWSSSNDAVASVSNSGLVWAHALGSVVIAANADNVVGTVTVVVVPEK